MAMEPMGHVAGIAAAIIGSVSSIMSMSIGTVIGQMYNGTLIPVTTGFLIFGSISMAILTFAQKFKVKHQEKAAEQTEQSKAEASEPAWLGAQITSPWIHGLF